MGAWSRMCSRRTFLGAAGAFALSRPPAGAAETDGEGKFSCDNPQLQKTYDSALEGLRANTRTVMNYARPVLIEGANYGGVWLECAPLEGLVYAGVSSEVAEANHDVFFELQREDGYLPCWVRVERIGSAQIQMVVPIAATAWELYQRTGRAGFLQKAYSACARWDEWLVRYRNTRRTGLCEAFCEYDTGHDNSPRWKGMPRACPNSDARLCPDVDGLPYLAPDLSATVFGGRLALAAMARETGRTSDEARWLESAESIRKAILERLYDSRDAAFYDLDSHDRPVRIRGDVISRVLGEHVPDRGVFDAVYKAQIRNPAAFWSPYPFPSIALNDPSFVRPIPRNSWGGGSQALTALRAPRWMEHYGKSSDLRHIMAQWVNAITKAGAFLQQMDPESGEFTPDRGGYSPAMLVFIDYMQRLYGVRAMGDSLEWNCRLPQDAGSVRSAVRTSRGEAELRATKAGSRALLGGKELAEIRGEARLLTGLDGTLRAIVGTASAASKVVLIRPGDRERSFTVRSDQTVPL